MTLGSQIKAWRWIRGITQKELAKLAGINTMHLSHFECDRRLPNLPNFKRICCALAVSADELIRHV